MFCKNCGKDIGDAKFCPYCGSQNEGNPNVTVNLSQNYLFTTFKDKIKQIGQGKLIKLISIISIIINIIIRIVNNEIKVVYNFLAQDDYFVISESGRNYMLFVIALQIIISIFLYQNAKKEQTNISKNVIVLFVISLVIQVLTMVLQLPAPY